MNGIKQGGNGITDKGAIVLAEALKADCVLQFLDLVICMHCTQKLNGTVTAVQVDNRITDKGALALVEALHANSTLQWLELVTDFSVTLF
jgi:hypothetical protein